MNPLRKLREFLHSLPDESFIEWKTKSIIDEIRDTNRTPDLCSNILTRTDSGVTSSRCCNEELIVSLSTFGDRIHSTAITVESLLEQTVKPNRIILNLGRQFEGKGKIPGSLKLLERRGLEIRFTRDIGPYTKLLPTLEEAPNASIITVDDDVLYGFDFISNLVNEHIQHPNEIIASRCRQVEAKGNKFLSDFLNWGFVPNGGGSSLKYLGEGYMGILYPPDTLDERVFDEKLFLNLCPSTDDFWFKAMSMLKCVPVRKAYLDNDDRVNLRSSRIQTLHDINKGGGYDRQIKAVFDYFDLWPMLDNCHKPWMNNAKFVF